MKKGILLAASLVVAGGIAADAQSITGDDVARMRDRFRGDPSVVAIQNVLTSNGDIRALALNHGLDGKVDHYFKYRVNVKGITDQKQSGRCWMFTSMNVLRPSVMEKYNLDEFDFSHNYLYFWDMLEKANLFLENVAATASKPMDDREVVHYFSAPLDDGGVWNLYYNIAGKYGVVPAQVMPETPHSENTAQMVALINEKLRAEGYRLREALAGTKGKARAAVVKEHKDAALNDVYRMLALCLGEPPVEFEWRFRDRAGNLVSKTYTPLEFYAEITPNDYSPENYIMIMNDPTREYYRVYDISNYRNTVEGVNWVYLNLPNDAIKRAALASIKNNEAMYASCDVNKHLNRRTGVMDPAMYDYGALFGVDLSMDKKARILTRQSGSSHAMTLIGVDTDENDVPVKWEFENSWGTEYGNKGYLTFTDAWFDEYMFRLVIHKRYLDEKAVEALSGDLAGITDEASAMERLGRPVRIVPGRTTNIKVTEPADGVLASLILGDGAVVPFRVGQGYDSHRLVEGRPLILGGVQIPFELGLDGHSDADVLLHAVTDAVLGAAALGDIGQHFPPSDPKWKGADSRVLLRAVVALARQKGWTVVNCDATIVAERPKIGPHMPAIRASLAETLGVSEEVVNVKAKTNERMDAVGRMEGMMAQAVVLMSRMA